MTGIELLHQHNDHVHLKKRRQQQQQHRMVRNVPKGCLAIRVGGDGEERQRFVIPLLYFTHPLFIELLKGAEEQYGFDHKGAITIPCHVDQFRFVQALINKERRYHQQQHVPCFGV